MIFYIIDGVGDYNYPEQIDIPLTNFDEKLTGYYQEEIGKGHDHDPEYFIQEKTGEYYHSYVKYGERVKERLYLTKEEALTVILDCLDQHIKHMELVRSEIIRKATQDGILKGTTK
jgi:hypothetical protein